jgi:dTDP-4-dehydrorhamnose reductase
LKQVLVTGGEGQVGRAIARQSWPQGWEAVPAGRTDLDLADAVAIRAKVAERPWAAVINAGAFTAVDRAEAEPIPAWTLNALAPAVLAEGCRQADIPLIHISTDYVFDGSKTGAWEVDDPTNPLNVYGASKLGGELAIRSISPRHAIVRTAWIVSAHGTNFLKTMLRLGTERRELRIVADQIGSPTSADDLAHMLVAIAVRMADDRDAPGGLFHFTNSGITSWHGLAEEIFRAAGLRCRLIPHVSSIGTQDHPRPAPRPANSVLSMRRIEEIYGVRPRAWQTAIDDILDELIGPRT